MKVFQFVLIAAAIISAFPIGILIAKNTKDESRKGRFWFKLLSILCLIAIISGFALFKGDDLILFESVFDFMLLLSLASLYESNKIGGK